ncbi:MAG: sulfur oxidation c-type cytochrome SoxX [Thiomicrorhabdus sp.]|nr:sulfur oxidation c-type cytochrome SoxX [Thiomicrorhabdus sp.]
MISKMKHLLAALAISGFVTSIPLTATAAEPTSASIEEGKKLAFSRSKGNCLACHAIKGGSMPGNMGPALIAMKLRYPDKQKLVKKIWGVPEQTIPNSIMPPFGKHGILTDSEINTITDYIYTL